MKTLCLFILTFVMLYNPKVQASDELMQIHPLESLELEIERIALVTKNPLIEVDQNLESYIELVNLFKKFRAYNIDLSYKLLEKFENNNTFSGDDLYLIKRTFDIFFKLNSKMMEFGDLYEFKSSTMSKTFSAPEIKLPMVKAHLVWLSANLMVLDHIQEIHQVLFMEDGALRRIIKTTISDTRVDSESRKKLKNLSQQINRAIETGEDLKFSQQINLVRSIEADLKILLEHDDNALALLKEIMENRTSTQIAQGRRSFKLSNFGFGDAAIGILNKISNFLSGFFGNIAGSIKWRKGYLFDNQPAMEMAKASLRPMDIILEKSPFVLTDKFIPGHYGHVAIYLGTKSQLEEIGMWNHPDILPYQEQIEKGKTILEAIRPGVRLSSMEEFMNIDEFTIVRKTDGLDSPLQVTEQVTRGMDQIGKSYDFNFDITTLDKIVCSELVYIVFGHVNWPTRYRLGRATITPDDIGEVLFQKGTRFKMTDYVISTQRHRIETANIGHLADIFDYEMRASDGDEIKDPADPTNSYWKKETKCYNLANEIGQQSRECRTTYKEYYYEEAAGI